MPGDAETAAPNPFSPYGAHKLIMECWSIPTPASDLASASRAVSVYGAGLRKQLLWDLCAKLARGDSRARRNRREQRDFIHGRMSPAR